jgi:peptide/nickel transport system permease protein
LNEDFVRTARAKGLAEQRVLIRHALANSARADRHRDWDWMAMLIGGVVVTESVFSIPGWEA